MSTTPPDTAAPPNDPPTPPRTPAAAWWALLGTETRSVARDTAGLLVPLGMPVLILVMSAGQAQASTIPGTGGRTGLDLFVLPLVLAMTVALVAVVNMPSFLSSYRKTGVLRRLAVTPVSPLMVLVAQFLVSLLQIATGLAVAAVTAFTLLGARIPAAPLHALGGLLLATVAFYAIGMMIAALAPSPNAAIALGLTAFLGMGAIGGMFSGPDALPAPVAAIGGVLPFGAMIDLLGTAAVGAPADISAIIGCCVVTVVGTTVSTLTFRWD